MMEDEDLAQQQQNEMEDLAEAIAEGTITVFDAARTGNMPPSYLVDYYRNCRRLRIENEGIATFNP